MCKRRKSVFVSYSHKDKSVVDELKTCLAPWVREKRLSVWDDSQISPGDRWSEEIERAIVEASIAVLVVSADFLASDYVMDKELPLIVQRAHANQLRVIWIAANHSPYKVTAIAGFQAANDPNEPLLSLTRPKRTKKLVAIAEQISNALTVSSLAGGLELIDATTEPFEARVDGRPEQQERQFGVQAAYEASSDRIVFEGTTSVITADDLTGLPSDDREFIADLEDGLRRNYDRWRKIRENLGGAAGALDSEIEHQLTRVAKLICRDLNHILDFLRKMHKYELEDHYGRYRYICDRLEQG